MSGNAGYEKVKEKFALQRQKLVQEAIDKYEKNPFACKQCGSKIPYEKRNTNPNFCNRSCSATFNNVKRSIERNSKKIIKKCLNCDELLLNQNKTQKYCSIKCQHVFKREERYEKLSQGNDIGVGHVAAKNAIIAKHGAKCMQCGWAEINPHSGKCPIELEHVDGNSQNNKLDNLRLLCPNCHSLTSTYKALNIGKGRHKRRQRYQDGKSY